MKKEAAVHQTAEEAEESQKKQTEEKINEVLDHAAKNREAHFKAMKERLEEKKRHAEKVRQARLARMAEKAAAEESGEGDAEKKEEDVSAVWRRFEVGESPGFPCRVLMK